MWQGKTGADANFQHIIAGKSVDQGYCPQPPLGGDATEGLVINPRPSPIRLDDRRLIESRGRNHPPNTGRLLAKCMIHPPLSALLPTADAVAIAKTSGYPTRLSPA